MFLAFGDNLWAVYCSNFGETRRRYQTETFSTLLALCAWNSPVTGEFPSQSPVMRSFGVFFGLRLNKHLSKQSRRRWFETPSRSLWRHCVPEMTVVCISRNHDDVIKWKHFPHYWPFVRGIHRSPVNSQHKGQWRGALMLSLICVGLKGWVNNREAGDLRRHTAHCDVIVMCSMFCMSFQGDTELFQRQWLWQVRMVMVSWRTYSLKTAEQVGRPPWWRHQMEAFSALPFTGHRWIPHTKASDAELWCFSLICIWLNGWVNNHEAGDLRRYRAHYDVILIYTLQIILPVCINSLESTRCGNHI